MPEGQGPAVVSSSVRSGWGAANPHAELAHRVAFRVFVATTVLAGVLALVGVRAPSVWSWLYAFHVVVALLATMAALTRRLPLQNVIACALALALTMGMALAMVGHELGEPPGQAAGRSESVVVAGLHGAVKEAGASGAASGPAEGRSDASLRALDWRAWPAPLLWTAFLLGSRQTAKVLLQPWRRQKPYGWWLLGTAAGLAWLAVLASTPVADRVMGWWTWTSGSWSWYGMPPFWLILALFLIGGLLLLAGAWLVPKRRTGRPADFDPVWLWSGLMAWFTLGNLREGLWMAAGLGLAAVAAVIPLAWRAARMPISPASGSGGSA